MVYPRKDMQIHPLLKDPVIAAIDVGTNSLHLLVAQVDSQGHLTILDADKLVLRLGEQLDSNRMLTEEAMVKTVKAIKHMKEIAASYKPIYRPVATHALRDAKNYQELLHRIFEATHIQVALIPGEEEARLVSLGMQAGLPLGGKSFLGLDIGGGSTEMIVCRDEAVPYVSSVALGSVVLSRKFLKDKKIERSHLFLLENEISQKLSPLNLNHQELVFDCAVVCSGVAKTLAMMHAREFRGEELEDSNGYRLSVADIEHLYAKLHKLRSPEKIREHWRLEENRADIILAGVAILRQITACFAIKEWLVSTGGLREGLVLDTYSRLRGLPVNEAADIRWQNIVSLGKRLQVDQLQAERVSKLALEIFDQLTEFVPPLHADESSVQLSDRGFLQAAAWLHECGKFINFSRYHKHAFYLIANSRLMGFSQNERKMIGLIARYQRKGKAHRKNYYCQDLATTEIERINYLASILRLAVAANRSRQGFITSLTVERQEDSFVFTIRHAPEHKPLVDAYKMNQEKSFLEGLIGKPILLKGV